MAAVITSIIAIAATVGLFYLMIIRRTKSLSAVYPDDKFIGVKETFACIGMSLYPFIAIFLVILAIFLGTKEKRRR